MRTRRETANGVVRVRLTVLAVSQTEVLELYGVADADVPGVGSQVDYLVYVRTYVDRTGVARYSLQPAARDDEF